MKFYYRNDNKVELTDELMRNIADLMDDEIREDLHCKLAPCAPEVFLSAYMAEDEGFAAELDREFSIVALEDDIADLVDAVTAADTWDTVADELAKLADYVGLAEAWADADGDSFEAVIRRIGNALGVALI